MSNNFFLKSSCFGVLMIFLSGILYGQGILKLDPSQVYSETGHGNPQSLVDEPWCYLSEESSNPKTVWKPGYNQLFAPYAAILDMQSENSIHEINYFDGEGQGAFQVFIGLPGNWKFLFESKLDQHNVWRKVKIPSSEGRYLRVVLTSSIAPMEIYFLGTELKKVPLDKNITNAKGHKRETVDQWLGINGFIDDPVDKLTCGAIVREYHDLKWNLTSLPFSSNSIQKRPSSSKVMKFNPSYPGWDLDAYYTSLIQAGMEIVICIQNSLPWFASKNSSKPAVANSEFESPETYLEHGKYLYQFAARYGKSKVPTDSLNLTTNQPPKTGLGLVRYFENWNEPDRWWEERASYFRPFEFSALCSADYDGHQGKLGKNVGIKNADRSSVMVMGGLIALDSMYLRAMKLWSKVHRGGSFPADVLNVHYYPDHPNGHALSPEEDQMKDKFKKFKMFCNREFPNKPVWVSEFGYDTDPDSKRKCPEIGSLNRSEVQAQWLIRASLEALAAGIDRFFIYMLRNVADAGGEQYLTSGLTSSKDSGHIPKIGWYYIQGFRKILKNMVFYKDISEPGVRIYIFKSLDSKKVILALWSPTSSSNEISNFKIVPKFNVKHAELLQLQKSNPDFLANGIAKFKQENKYFVTISETPVFLSLELK